MYEMKKVIDYVLNRYNGSGKTRFTDQSITMYTISVFQLIEWNINITVTDLCKVQKAVVYYLDQR